MSTSPNERPVDALIGLQAVADHLGITYRQAYYRAILGVLPVHNTKTGWVGSRRKLDAWVAGELPAPARDVAA